MWRIVYQKAVDPETFIDDTDIRGWISRTAEEVGCLEWETVPLSGHAWRTTRAVDYQQLIQSQADRDSRDRLTSTLLRQSAPMASALGCWWQGMSAPGVFDDQVQLRILALLADDIGVGRPGSSRFDEFTLLLRQHGVPELAVTRSELAADRSLPDEMFALPAVLLAMSRRSDAFGPELCGVDFAFRSIGLLPAWGALRGGAEQLIDWDRLDLSASSWHADPLAESRWVAEQYRALGADNEQRVNEGATWLVAALNRWDSLVFEAGQRSIDPEQAMAALIRDRAREGAVYHHDFMLGERALATWLSEARTDPLPLVRELATSRLVKPGDSAHSALVNGLVSSRGPMFRVFSAEDLAIVRRWIDWLPASAPQAQRSAVTCGSVQTCPEEPAQVASMATGHLPRSLREAYFVLQGRALAPCTRTFAIQYVQRWLAWSRRSLDRTERSLPAAWRSGELRAWLLDQHDKHDAEFERSSTELPSRDAVVDSTVQLAPLTLIDGSWLQGFTDMALGSSRFGCFLFETYWDELGNGKYDLNHPKIYRDVLRQMGVELPPTGSWDFAMDKRFRDSSFRLPVYWLCLGKLPVTFLPEILGMNLAMELSGVGGSYRSARKFLRHYGFSTRFVDIHNTIDNVSTGHSAWAADAIDSYLHDIARLGPPAAHTQAWERVRTGYESLAPLTRRLFRFRSDYYFSTRDTVSRPDQRKLYHHMPANGVG